MDRNEKQNSHRNTNNTRGMNKKVKKYRNKMIVAICAAGILLIVVIGLLIGYMRLNKKYEEAISPKNTEKTEDQSGGVITDETGTEPNTISETLIDEGETKEDQSDNTIDETALQSGENQSETVAGPSESDTDQAAPVSESGMTAEKAEEIKNAVNAAIANYAGLEYWLVPMPGEAVINNSGVGAESVVVSEIQDFGKLFVLGKMYDRMQKSVANVEEGMREVPIEGSSENISDLRSLAEIMMGLRAGDIKIKEGPMAAADELIGRIGENFGGNAATEENVINKENRFSDGLKKIQEFASSIGSSTVMISGFDTRKDAGNVIYLSDCINYFDSLAKDGFGLDEERLPRMKQLLAKIEGGFAAAMQEVAGEGCEVLCAEGTSKDNAEYTILLVTQGNKQYVIAVKAPAGLDPSWENALAQAVFGAVPEKATAETAGQLEVGTPADSSAQIDTSVADLEDMTKSSNVTSVLLEERIYKQAEKT